MLLDEAFAPVFRVNDPPHRVKRSSSTGVERRDDVGFTLLEGGLDEHSRQVVHGCLPVFGWHLSDTPGPVRIADKAEQGADCRRGPLLAMTIQGGHFGSRRNERNCLLYSHRNDRVRLVLPSKFFFTHTRGKGAAVSLATPRLSKSLPRKRPEQRGGGRLLYRSL